MKKFFSALILASILLSSCSTMKPERNIAAISAINTEAQAAADSLFSFNKSNTALSDISLKQNIEDNINLLLYQSKIKAEWIKDDKLNPDVAFKIEPKVENNISKLVIRYSDDAFNDHPAVLNLTRYMESTLYSTFKQKYALFELYYNALQNDPISMHAVAKLRRGVLTQLNGTSLYDIETSQYNGYVLGEAMEWDKKVSEYAKLEKKKNAEKKPLTEQRKAAMAALDALPENKQFRYRVSVGDRQGAADLIQAYLPWEEMAPFEKRFWETHLDIMRNPLPLSERVLIYRGIDDDLIQTPVTAGTKLSVEDAIKEQNIFLMSTMMTKNQGSWNRRLRSLTSMYEKFIGTTKDKTTGELSSEFAKAARISVLFKNHSSKPDGSPFLSFTPEFEVANTFGQTRVSAYLMDPRAIEYNHVSGFEHEKEFLAPLVTFPDEIIAVHDKNLLPSIGDGRDKDFNLQKMIQQNLESKLGAAEGIETYRKVRDNSKKYFNGISLTMRFDDVAIAEKTQAKAAEIAKLPKIEPKNTLNPCADIVKNFFN